MIRTLCLTLVLLPLSAFAQGVSLSKIQQTLKQSRAGWKAADNNFVDLSLAEKRDMLGLRDAPAPSPFEQEIDDIEAEDDELPASWDWRNVNGKNFDTVMRYQGRCGSCVAFATIAAVEMQLNIAGKNPDMDLDFSEQHMFMCGRASCQTGWFATSGFGFFKQAGVPDEQCFAYQSGNLGEDLACEKTCADSKDRSTIIKGYTTITSGTEDIEKIKKALLKGPLLTTMRVYEDFYAYSGGVYEYKTGPFVGGHAITMLGYDNAKKAWLVKNSWGDEWGDKGYFWIKWGEQSGLGKSTYQADVDPVGDFVKIVSPADYDVLTGKATIEVENRVEDAVSVSYVLKSKGSAFVQELEAAPEGSTFTFNTTKFPDGLYDMVVEVNKGDKVVRSQHRAVYILNSTPEVGLKISDPADGMSVSGKILLTYECAAQKIPFTSVTTVVEGNGVKKTYDVTNPCPKAKVRLRTYTVPNGTYKVYGIGKIGNVVQKASTPVTLTIVN